MRSEGVFVCHNHPTGNPSPSDADKSLTNDIDEGLEKVDKTLCDHVVIGVDGYASFRDKCIYSPDGKKLRVFSFTARKRSKKSQSAAQK